MRARLFAFALALAWLATLPTASAEVVSADELSFPDFYAAPGDNVEWTDFKPIYSRTDPTWGPILTDIVEHLPANQYGTYYDADKVTHAHETSHGIHAHLRNNFNRTGKKANAFYALQNRAAIVIEPNMRKSQVGAFVPANLRGPRYSTYVTGQSAWDDTPLYIFDEWNAYVNGGAEGVNLVEAGLWRYGQRDAVEGQLEFVVYALATAMAIQRFDNNYFVNYAQFREFLAFNIARSMSIFHRGAKMPVFARATQDQYFVKFKTSPEAATMRNFASQLFGETWVNENIFP